MPSSNGVLETIRMPVSLRSSDRYRTDSPGWKCQLTTTSTSIASRSEDRRLVASFFVPPIVESFSMAMIHRFGRTPDFSPDGENA